MSKDSSAKYYQNNKEKPEKKACDIKISQQYKHFSEDEKQKLVKREKTPYNYQKILLVFLKSNDIEKYLNEE